MPEESREFGSATFIRLHLGQEFLFTHQDSRLEERCSVLGRLSVPRRQLSLCLIPFSAGCL